MNQIPVQDDLKSLQNEDEIIQYLMREYLKGRYQFWLNKKCLVTLNPKYILHKISPSNQDEIYHICRRGFQELKLTQAPIYFILNGLSGSGKTENSKLIIKNLLAYSKLDSNQVLIDSNTLLDLMGNAKTKYNANSSRFGKLIHINYNRDFSIINSEIEVYLLEKSRIIFKDLHAVDETFHIFKVLLANLSENELSQNILPPNSDTKVEHSWSDIAQILSSRLHFTDDQIGEFKNILLVILQLNLLKIEVEAGDSGLSSTKEGWRLKLIASLLGVEREDLEEILLNNVTKPGPLKSSRRMTIYSTRCSYFESICKRNSLLRFLYYGLFSFIVERVNDSLKSRVSIDQNYFCKIGILDMYGFENMNENGFEQFSINYANEVLHRLFVKTTIDDYVNDMIEDGIADGNLSARDSEYPCLSAMDSIIDLLDQACTLQRQSKTNSFTDSSRDPREISWINEMSLLFPIRPTKGNNRAVVKVTKSTDQKNGFSIHHFAGQLTYTTRNFPEKNFDKIDLHSITKLFGNIQSNNEILSRIVQTHNPLNSDRHDQRKRVFSVLTNFKISVKSLANKLHEQNLFHIKCILPEYCKSSLEIDQNLLSEHLQNNGVFDTLKVTRDAFFSSRLTKEQFHRKFSKTLFPENDRDYDSILERYHLEESVVGRSRIFLTHSNQMRLEKIRLNILRVKARIISNFMIRSHKKITAAKRNIVSNGRTSCTNRDQNEFSEKVNLHDEENKENLGPITFGNTLNLLALNSMIGLKSEFIKPFFNIPKNVKFLATHRANSIIECVRRTHVDYD